MNKNIFEFKQYKHFLREVAGTKRQRLGIKSDLAKALKCQPTYISHVVQGEAHFSLEQAEKVARYFGFSKDETRYFLRLVQKDRAGSHELRSIFEEELSEILAKRLNLKDRLGNRETLSQQDASVYYSSWHYAAIHIAVGIPELQSREKLINYFRIPKKRLNQVLNFLIDKGVLVEKNNQLSTGKINLRIGNDSDNIIKHHTNWRVRAIESLDLEDSQEFHYSAVMSLSRTDIVKIKELIMEALKNNLEIVRESREEELYAYNIDFFNLRNNR